MGINKDISEAFDKLHENYNLATISAYYTFLNRFSDNVLFENAELILSEPSNGTNFMLEVMSRVFPNAEELASHLECATEIADAYNNVGNDEMVESLENYKEDLIFLCVSKEPAMEGLMDDLIISSIPDVPDNITAKFIKPILESAKYGDEQANREVDDFYNEDNLSGVHVDILVGVFPKILITTRKVMIAKLIEMKKKRLELSKCSDKELRCFSAGDSIYNIEQIPLSFCRLIIEGGETNSERLNQLIALLNNEIDLFSNDITSKVSYKNEEKDQMEIPWALNSYINRLIEAKQILLMYKEDRKDIINDNVMAMQPQVGFPEEDGVSESYITLEQACEFVDLEIDIDHILEAKGAIKEDIINSSNKEKAEKELNELLEKIEKCTDENSAKKLIKAAAIIIAVNFILTSVLTIVSVTLLISGILKMIKRVATSPARLIAYLVKQISSVKVKTVEQKKRKTEVEKKLSKKVKGVTEAWSITEEEYYEAFNNCEAEDTISEVLLESPTIVSESQLIEAEIEADRAVIEFATYGDDAMSDEKLIELFENLLSASMYLEALREQNDITMEANVITKASMGIQKASRKVQHKIKNTSIQGNRATAAIDKTAKSIDDQINRTIEKIKAADNAERKEKIIKGGLRVKIKRLIRMGIVTGLAGTLGNSWFALVALLGQIIADKRLDTITRRELVDDIEDNLRLLDEKIDDAKGESNKEAKYKLMRQRNALKKERDRIRYNLSATRTRDAEIVNKEQ